MNCMSWMIPGGHAKGTPLEEATDKDLRYWADRIGRDLDAGESRDEGRDRPLHQAMVAELAKREGGQAAPATNGSQQALARTAPRQGQPQGGPAPAPQTALAVRQATELAGSYRDPAVVTANLQYAAENCHLVSPAPACPRLPEGCSVAINAVLIDKSETYEVNGGYALGKSALDKISLTAGISWDAQQSGRTDDGRDPHYCSWKAVGVTRHLDGTEVQLVSEKEMDLRDGSAQLNGKSPKRISQERAFIMAHAESKARNRAIRTLGIKSKYTEDELRKPFVVAKLMWTGESDDPELRHAFALKGADAMLGGTRALYGAAPPALPARAELPKHAPPPVSASRPDDDYPEAQGEPVDPRQQGLY